jgi:hypothetical protein
MGLLYVILLLRLYNLSSRSLILIRPSSVRILVQIAKRRHLSFSLPLSHSRTSHLASRPLRTMFFTNAGNSDRGILPIILFLFAGFISFLCTSRQFYSSSLPGSMSVQTLYFSSLLFVLPLLLNVQPILVSNELTRLMAN